MVLSSKRKFLGDFKIFRLSRFQSLPKICSPEKAFVISSEYKVSDYIKDITEHLIERAEIFIKPGSGAAIRKLGDVKNLDSGDIEWDLIQLNNIDFDLLVYNILWCGPDVKVIKPEILVKAVVNGLEKF